MNNELIKDKMLIALKIREVIHDIYKKHDVHTSLCIDDVNPFYNQIDENSQSFLCEYYYGHPSKIYTPLGELRLTASYFMGGEEADKAIKEIEETFGFVLKRDEKVTSMGVFGGWYFITKFPWDDTHLECECIERTMKEYIDYDTAREIYKEVLNLNNTKK